MNRRRALALLLALACLAWQPQFLLAAPGLRAVADVDRSLAFGTITIKAYVDVHAAPLAAWGVLTDYNRLAEFVPDMHYSAVVSKPGEAIRVHQRGEKSWLLLDTPFEVVMQMDETPMSRIRFRQLSGTLKKMHGEWRLTQYREWVRIHYSARIEPGMLSPRVPGDSWLIESDIQHMLEAIGQEILRRQAAQVSL